MRCEVCGKESTGKYCEAHERAYGKLVEKYRLWKRALNISWKEYLNEVVKNPYTGAWAREVAEQLVRIEGGEGVEP